MESSVYSQNDEERVILDFFAQSADAHAGMRFLDIGAFDGRAFSNTLALTELGWGGTLVEASPHAFIALKALYKGRGPSYNLVQACLGFDWRLRKFWDSPDAVATDDPKHEEKWRSLGQYQEVRVPELPLAALLDTLPGPYHFISIDVEGETTEKLFRAMPFRALQCQLVCVECNDESERFRMIGKSMGMTEIHKNGENLIFKV